MRNDSVVTGHYKRGGGLFISLEAFGSLLWLKISNIGTAWTCRTYIFGDCCLYYARIRDKRLFGAFRALCALSPCWVVYYIIVAKNALKSCFSRETRQRNIYKPLRIRLSVCLSISVCLSFVSSLSSLSSLPDSSLTDSLTHSPTYLLAFLTCLLAI